MSFSSILDYALNFGLPGLLLGVVGMYALNKKVEVSKRKKVLEILSFVYNVPYMLVMFTQGPSSYLNVIIYGVTGIAGVIFAVLAAREKHWPAAMLFILPIICTISIVMILGA